MHESERKKCKRGYRIENSEQINDNYKCINIYVKLIWTKYSE